MKTITMPLEEYEREKRELHAIIDTETMADRWITFFEKTLDEDLSAEWVCSLRPDLKQRLEKVVYKIHKLRRATTWPTK